MREPDQRLHVGETAVHLVFEACGLPIDFLVEEANRFGFAYGTLSVHPEQGEESFVVSRDADGSVQFAVEDEGQGGRR